MYKINDFDFQVWEYDAYYAIGSGLYMYKLYLTDLRAILYIPTDWRHITLPKTLVDDTPELNIKILRSTT